MAKILEFPKKAKVEEPHDHHLETARAVMIVMIEELVKYGYNPLNPGVNDDLGVLYNMMYAMVLRHDGEHHQFHEMMEEIANELKTRGSE